MKRLQLFALFIMFSFSAGSQTDLETRLFELPDVIFEKIQTPEGFKSAYKLKIKQPLDHKNPDRGHFYQKVYLSHRGYDKHTAIITNGYSRGSNVITEVSRIADANQLNVEHRYFGESVPDSLDYNYLNFEQVTADLHHINSLFRKIYNGKWISTGISKGGTTTIFYKYFYPDDVDVSIPYVAPVNYSDEDQRIYTFLDTIGSDECRKAIYDYQVRMLKNSDTFKPYIRWYTKGKDLKFNYLNFDEAFEYAILEYPFSFWQWGHDCSKIPSREEDTDTHIQHFIDIVGMSFYSDASMEGYASHYYQSGTEMGYYGFETDDFKGLLKYLPMDPNPSAVFTPGKMEVEFDGTLTNKVAKWISENGNNMIYINGALDTWSATAVPPSDKTNSLWFFMADHGHASARIRNLDDNDKSILQIKLTEWLETGIDLNKADPSAYKTRKLVDMMTGSFNSSKQAYADTAYFDITLHMYPIWTDRPGHWLYVEQSVTSFPDKPYRQRIYRIEKDGQGFVSKVYEINDPSRFTGKWKNPAFFDSFGESILSEREGCDVHLMPTENGYSGSTKDDLCSSTLRGARYATSRVSIIPGKIESWDQGFDDKDQQVWGAVNGAYVFMKTN
ncbi:MAG: hypothetical protein KJO50_11340 [Bacteroidia bacterium]|nr:hypothetical protein [Bacteroidia bacterium]